MAQRISITTIPAISAIYYGLLRCGYDFCSPERINAISNAAPDEPISNNTMQFFFGTKQNTCEVYPYWPRAAILETASFYLNSERTDFQNYDALYNQIMTANNLTDIERDESLWQWMASFPNAIYDILHSDGFQKYLAWENEWISLQNKKHEKALWDIQDCLDQCITTCNSPFRSVKIVLSPIKSEYSSDYHVDGECFIVCSGEFRVASVVHEFLHHVVHDAVIKNKDAILNLNQSYVGIDVSYYLSGDDEGKLNAFEEYYVRLLTDAFMCGNPPHNIHQHMNDMLTSGF